MRTHTERDGGLACNRIYSHTRTFMLTKEKKFAAHICSLCTDFYQVDCTVYQSHRSWGHNGRSGPMRENEHRGNRTGVTEQEGDGEKREREENNSHQ